MSESVPLCVECRGIRSGLHICECGSRGRDAVEQIERAWGSARGLTPLSAPCDCGSTDSVNAGGECVTCAFQSRPLHEQLCEPLEEAGATVTYQPWNQPHALSDEAALVRDACRNMVERGHGDGEAPITAGALLALLDAHTNDLADMRKCVDQVEEVYMHIAGLSKWNTDPIWIKGAHDDAIEKAEKEEREHVLDQIADVERVNIEPDDRSVSGWVVVDADQLDERIAQLRKRS